jgi:transposase
MPGLREQDFETILLKTRHVKAVLSAMTVKADSKDACSLRAAGCAEAASRKVARCGIEHSGNLRAFGLKVGQVTRKTFEARTLKRAWRTLW